MSEQIGKRRRGRPKKSEIIDAVIEEIAAQPATPKTTSRSGRKMKIKPEEIQETVSGIFAVGCMVASHIPAVQPAAAIVSQKTDILGQVWGKVACQHLKAISWLLGTDSNKDLITAFVLTAQIGMEVAAAYKTGSVQNNVMSSSAENLPPTNTQ